MKERFELPNLFFNEGTTEQLALRMAATAIGYEIQRLEDDGRASGWESLHRAKALEAAAEMRKLASELHARGTVGLETRVDEELTRMRGYPCDKCNHRHEGSRYGFRCFQCFCAERPTVERA